MKNPSTSSHRKAAKRIQSVGDNIKPQLSKIDKAVCATVQQFDSIFNETHANDKSPIPGYREGNNITAEDRITNISALALMMKNDLIKLHEACSYLSKELNTDVQSKEKQFLKRLSLVKAWILALSEYSKDILDLKKTSATYNAEREKSFNAYQMKMKKQLEKQKKS